eukprot:TRINITY_DN70173_c0_g1_i1.p1 TRINITY_DN70173_c0_g1~~TRINITY_DN70173_c0_g1_i1.p1  ORF type:complete len:392 (+),score=57.16 TRINITY_DN70173_c0_g1_i1:28-1176(+)
MANAKMNASSQYPSRRLAVGGSGCGFIGAAVFSVMLLQRAAAKGPFLKRGAKGFGGGSAATPGHGRPMQEVGHKSAAQELSEVPSWDEFHEKYVRTNTPVVFRGAARKQRAFDKWTDEYLVGIWGNKGSKRTVDVEIKKIEDRDGPKKEMSFQKFVKAMYKEKYNDKFYAIIGLENDPVALADLDLVEPTRCEEIWPQSVTLWMSAGGTQSVLHSDDAENFLSLLDGYKSVMLVHQDQTSNMYASIAKTPGTSAVQQDNVDMVSFPAFANISWLHAELGPGDTLYIPHTYWHQVNSKGRNLAVNVWWQHRDDFEWFDERYSNLAFGTGKLPPFEYYKAVGRERLQCTPLPAEQHMDTIEIVDEGETKDRFRTMREKAQREGL